MELTMHNRSSEARRTESVDKQYIKKLNRGGKRRRLLAAQLAACSPEATCGQKECLVCVSLSASVAELPGNAGSSPAIPDTQAIPIDAIDPVFNQRPLVEANVDIIVNSIKVNGMRHPISVAALADNRYGLLDGAYRLAALKRLGSSEIQCCIEANEDAARRWNLAANLSRVDLTALERALSLTAYLELVRADLKGGQVAQPGGNQPNDKGYSRAADELGWSREKIRRAATISELSASVKLPRETGG